MLRYDRQNHVQLPFTISGQEMERVYSYNPGACKGLTNQQDCRSALVYNSFAFTVCQQVPLCHKLLSKMHNQQSEFSSLHEVQPCYKSRQTAEIETENK